MVTRDLDLAKAAFATQDSNLSRIAHEESSASARLLSAEGHTHPPGTKERSFIKGAHRGLVISFLSICVCLGSGISGSSTFLISLALLIGLSCSEAWEKYIHNHYKLKFKLREKNRESWELDNYPEGECKEMIELYVDAGFSLEDAQQIIWRMSKNPSFFVDHMLVQELGIMPPKEGFDPLQETFALGLGSFLEGLLPILPFGLIFVDGIDDYEDYLAIISLVIYCTCSFKLGAITGSFYEWRPSWIWNGMFSLIKNALVASIALGFGFAIRSIQ